MVVAFFIALITVEPRDSLSYAILPESTQRTSSPTLPHQRKELTEPDLSEPETLKAGNCYPTITSTRTPTVKLSSRTSSPTSQRREAWWDSQETERGSPKVCYLHKSKYSFPAFEGSWKWDHHVWSSIRRYFSFNWFIQCANIGKILLNSLVIKIIQLLELNSFS